SELTGYDAFASRVPVRRAPGLLVRTPPTEPHLFARHILYTADEGHLHIRPTPDGGLLVGADDTDGLMGEERDESAMREGAKRLLTRVYQYLPGLAQRHPMPELIEASQLKLGIRPVPQDSLPILGRMPGATGLHVAVTHSGITLAPRIGELIADGIQLGKAPDDLGPFSFDRFQSGPTNS
nr:FAD-binding oxidoreductase [Gammaproteobacteria bacterium]